MPKGPTVIANPLLTSFACLAYKEDLVKQFAGLSLFPPFYTSQKSASYYVLDRKRMLSLPDKIARAPGDTFAREVMKVSDDTFTCREYGFEEPVDDTERAVYLTDAESDYAAINRSVHILAYNHELRVKKQCEKITQKTPVGTKWNLDAANPIADVKAAKAVIHKNSGIEANTLMIPRTVYDALTESETILNRIKYVDGSSITEEILARLFGVSRVVVAGGIRNLAAEGQALNPGYIWGSDCYLVVANTDQDLKMPTFGRTFICNGADREENRSYEGELVSIGTYRDETRSSDVHRARHLTDEKIIGMELGYCLQNCI